MVAQTCVGVFGVLGVDPDEVVAESAEDLADDAVRHRDVGPHKKIVHKFVFKIAVADHYVPR